MLSGPVVVAKSIAASNALAAPPRVRQVIDAKLATKQPNEWACDQFTCKAMRDIFDKFMNAAAQHMPYIPCFYITGMSPSNPRTDKGLLTFQQTKCHFSAHCINFFISRNLKDAVDFSM
jgi:hypothetical protein